MDKTEVDLRIHELIKTYVLSSGLSNSELARRCDVDRATVGRWLKSGNISRNNLLKLCKVLGISQATFFEVIELPKETSTFYKKKKVVITKIESLPQKDAALLSAIDKLLS
ncbi:helix-turn-helix transcriptional regulator [Vibrio sp. 10N.261.55.E12]|uniref:HTH cro/C1-type domain-containing protein n=2 Tax=Vibrio cyclitrophicus TaxID=47951 RepID=A0A7Z1S056_9VIBR|nr:helix-turn-helix transcriptional regulator [Vibrio cyclitrophicus]PMP22867.1 hypothetical protein BCS90_25690 [Vibrio cyclitrophicus]PMP23575.1 hypothetical protein BCS91_14740 [Vibrio cyclitrophicus]